MTRTAPYAHRRFDELARLDDRVVLVTGGAGFISHRLCRLGGKVVVDQDHCLRRHR
jgi:phosphoserine phosphatase